MRVTIGKNTVQAFKYPSAHAVSIPVYARFLRQLIENKNDLIKIDKTKMAAAASFSISHENGQY